MTTNEAPDREEFAHFLALARANRWSIPDPETDSHGPGPWLRHWRALELRDRTGARWRPIQPHTVGTRGPEDAFQRAERINRNRDLWRGYLT